MLEDKLHLCELKKQVDELEKIIINIENGYIQRIGHLGEALHCLSEENNLLRNNISRIQKLEQEYEKMKEFFGNAIETCVEVNNLMVEKTLEINTIKRIPHKCPVCDGKGEYREESDIKHNDHVIGHFKSYGECETCKGKGII